MKKIFLIGFLFASPLFWAQNTFEQGNALYQKEKFAEAATAYESIVNSGKQSAEVYFNLGNCYYKLHQIAPAIFNYEKALQLNPNDQEIKTNLDFARKMAIDDIKVIPKVGFNKIIADFTSQYYYDTWAWIAIALAFVFFLCFLGYYFSNTTLKKRVFFISMFIFLISILTSVLAGVFEKNRLENEKIAIVFAETSAVKSEPKINATDAFVLHEGAKVFVIESIANWKKIQLTDETTGWIESENIKELN